MAVIEAVSQESGEIMRALLILAAIVAVVVAELHFLRKVDALKARVDALEKEREQWEETAP